MNPFKTDYFVWMDAGIVRDKMMVDTTPRPFSLVSTLVPPRTMGFLEVVPLSLDLVRLFHSHSKQCTRRPYNET